MPVDYDPNDPVDVSEAEIEAWIGEIYESPYVFDAHDNQVPHAKELAIWQAVTRRTKDFSNTLLGGNDFVNSGAELFQRGGISVAVAMTDAVYNGPDRIYSLVQGANATIQQVSVPTGLSSGSFYARKAIRLVAGGTTNRFGIASALKAEDSIPMRGRSKTFSFTVAASKNAGSGSINVRYAILEWTGTADSVTKDVVNNWASTTYTGGNFFVSTTTNVLATGVTAITHNTAQSISLNATIGASCNNIILMIWHQDVPAHASDRIDISEFGFWLGSYAPSIWVRRPLPFDRLLCQHHYWKTFRHGVVPAQNVGIADLGLVSVGQTGGAGVTAVQFAMRFPVPMFGLPAVITYNPAAANAQIRNATTASDFTGTTVDYISEDGCRVYGTTPGGSAAGQSIYVHMTAEKEL